MGSVSVHVLALSAIIGAAFAAPRVVQLVKPRETVQLIVALGRRSFSLARLAAPVGGGGGGGDRDRLQAPKERLPQQDMEQLFRRRSRLGPVAGETLEEESSTWEGVFLRHGPLPRRIRNIPMRPAKRSTRGLVYYGSLWENGLPSDVRLSRWDSDLTRRAIDAVRQWRFEPALKDGKPVAAKISVEVSFRLY